LSAEAREWGRIYGHGLEALGFPRHRLLTATLSKPDAILWTIEEALKSAALAGVVADVGTGLDLTAVRRLMLAANAGQDPRPPPLPRPAPGRHGGAHPLERRGRPVRRAALRRQGPRAAGLEPAARALPRRPAR
jgi:hypothetical protein